MEESRIETVYQAINTLHHNPDSQKINEANRWLTELQKSVYGWKVADELLQRQVDIHSCYFGAQTIRNKIMFSLHELPQEAVLSLHSSLMQHLSKINEDTDNAIITQLCVAIVDLTLQMNTWNNPIYSFLKCNEIPRTVLLEILKVFPEEIDTKLIRLGANKRNKIQEELSSCAGHLNEFLKQVIIEYPRAEVLLKAIKCFTSWVSVIRNISDVVECDLIPKVFEILKDPPAKVYENESCIESKLHDAATDLLCNILKTLRGGGASSILDVNLCTKIAAFEYAYHMSVACESTEKSKNYSRIFTELGEAFLLKMVNETVPGNPHFSIQTLNLILICVGNHDYEVSSVTFNFWFCLAELLYNKDDDNLSNEFKPYVDRLLTALRRQVQMEPDSEGLLDDSDDFKQFRDKVCDLVKDLIFIVGSTYTFEKILTEMQNLAPLTWDQMEANLYIMYAIAWKISPGENSVIPRTVDSIFSLPETTHIAVKHTAILILGELRDWFDEHPNYLISALQYLGMNLRCKLLADAAASSMCYICCTAKTKLKSEFAPLLDILKNLNSFDVSNKSVIFIINGVVAVMCQLCVEDIIVAMKKICCFQVDPLRKFLESGNSSSEELVNSPNFNPSIWLDRLAAVFRSIVQPGPNKNWIVPNEVKNACVPALTEIQPVIFQIMDCFQKDVAVMERCCRCLRFAIRVVGKQGVFLLETLVHKLVALYQANGHSCFLYVGSILVDEYGDDSSNWDILLQMVDAFIGPTFGLLQHPDSFREHPDTIDDLFRLCSRILQRLPIAFLRSTAIWPLLDCSLVAISLDHKEANSSVMKFFHEMFDCANDDARNTEVVKKEAVRPIFEKHGEALVRSLLHASVYVLPSWTLPGVAEVLYDLIQFDIQVTMRWMNLAVQQLPNQSTSGSLMASPEQIQTFLCSCEQATKTRDILGALRDFTLYYY